MVEADCSAVCPTDDQLERHFAGLSSDADGSGIAAHVERCARCRAWLTQARADEELLGDIRRRWEQGGVSLRGADDATYVPGSSAEIPVVPGRANRRASPPAPLQQPPSHIGGYRILRKIGEGGMGLVYEAEQERPRRAVALKVLRPGAASQTLLRRFEHEAHVLARLQHPGIAQIYEAGTAETDGGPMPLFAMERIEGRPLVQYASEEKLDTRTRLELLEKVCQAVQHAHTKGVIHRDLKPGNILVTPAGHPKDLDFGVARLTDADVQVTTLHTDVGQVIGTLAYMSPEQVLGDPAGVDTRSDVYSLGVIGYELLTGRLPYDLARRPLHEAARIIREEEPTALRTIDKALRGDVETILFKALEKDKGRRYQSVVELAQDIRLYLNHEPIMARPPTWTYRVGKLVVRHKWVSVLLGALMTSLMTFSIVVSALWIRSEGRRVQAEDAQREAQTQAETATRVAASMMDLFGSLDPFAAAGSDAMVGSTLSPDAVLDRAAVTITTQLADQPEPQIKLLARLANVNLSRGRYAESEALARRALDTARAHFGREHLLVATAMRELSLAMEVQYRLEEAERLAESELAMRRRLHGDNHPDVAWALCRCADLAMKRGSHADAEPMLREALAIMQTAAPASRTSGEYVFSAADVLTRFGHLHLARGEHAEARTFYQEALEAHRRLGGDQWYEQSFRTHLVHAWRAAGDHARCESLLRELLADLRARSVGADPRIAHSLYELAVTRTLAGDDDAAEAFLGEALPVCRQSLGEVHPSMISLVGLAAGIMQRRGDFAAAEPLLRQNVDAARQSWSPHSAPLVGCLAALASNLQTQNKHDEAEKLYREIVAACRASPDADPEGPYELGALFSLARIRRMRGDAAAEDAFLAAAVALASEHIGERSPRAAESALIVAKMLVENGQLDAAEPYARRSLEYWESVEKQSKQRADAQARLGGILIGRGEPAAAADVYRRFAATRSELLGAEHPETQIALFHVATALHAAGRPEDARPFVDELFAAQQRALQEGRAHIGNLHNLVLLLDAQGDRARLQSLVASVVTIYEDARTLPENHPDRSGAPLLLGLLRVYLDDLAAAEPLLRESAELREKHLPADRQWMTAYAESVLGECLTRLQRFDEAEALLLPAWESIRPHRGDCDLRTHEVAHRVIRLHEARGRPDQAEQFRSGLPFLSNSKASSPPDAVGFGECQQPANPST